MIKETKSKYNIGDRVLFHSTETLIDIEGVTESFAIRIGNRYGKITGISMQENACLYLVKLDDIVFVCSERWFQPISEDHLIKPEPESRKNDRKDNKLMWELLPLETIEEAVKVFTFGAQKYGVNTWQNLPNGFERYRAAFLRHMVAHLKGEEFDPESGLLHLSHCLWNSIAMLHVYLAERKDKIIEGMMEWKQMDEAARKHEKEIKSAIREAPKTLDAYFEDQRRKAEELSNHK